MLYHIFSLHNGFKLTYIVRVWRVMSIQLKVCNRDWVGRLLRFNGQKCKSPTISTPNSELSVSTASGTQAEVSQRLLTPT